VDVYWLCDCYFAANWESCELAHVLARADQTDYPSDLLTLPVITPILWSVLATCMCLCCAVVGHGRSVWTIQLSESMQFVSDSALMFHTHWTLLLQNLRIWYISVMTSLSADNVINYCNAVVTCEIILFQNYSRSLLQLTNIFQHVQCRWDNFSGWNNFVQFQTWLHVK